jgi:hypothetical protein
MIDQNGHAKNISKDKISGLVIEMYGHCNTIVLYGWHQFFNCLVKI